MIDTTANNKRIAKNTLFLYGRMLLMMLINLYTSRVILNVLGVVDYGIYNVVGGFVSMFSVLRSGLVSATQRFITFELGRDDKNALQETYSSSMHIYIMVSILIVIVAETIGIWFIENKMIIPSDRIYAAHWVYQFSLLSLIIGLICNPQNALIIAHERMSVFAYISIYEAISKLVIVYLLTIGDVDKLILYSIFMCVIQLSLRLIYGIYCKLHFEESKVIWKFNWKKIKEMYSFTGWAMFGGLSVIGRTQGINMLLNIFFGPTVNAARGVAVQVLGTLNGFVSNFQTALNPQIVKNYAQKDLESLHKLILMSAKFSFILLYILSLPLFLETEYLLVLWLKNVPEYTISFVRLMFVISMIDAISNPLVRSIEASGKIRIYQMVAGSMMLMILPLSYVVLLKGGDPTSVYWITIIISSVTVFLRIKLASNLVKLDMISFIKKVIFNSILVALLSFFIPYYIHTILPYGFSRLMIVTFIAFVLVVCVSYYIMLDFDERNVIIRFFKNKLKHDRNKR